MDLVPEEQREELLARYASELGAERRIFTMSAATREGIRELVNAVAEEVDRHRAEQNQAMDEREDVRFIEEDAQQESAQ